MKLRTLLLVVFCLMGLSACVPKPITTDYGTYPSNYMNIVREFYNQDSQFKPIKLIKIHAPKPYTQKNSDIGFVVPISLKLWTTARSGQAMKGYVVCVAKRHKDEAYGVDAFLIHNNQVIGWIYNSRDAYLFYACRQENNELLGWLTETETEANNRFINNFMKSLRKKERAR